MGVSEGELHIAQGNEPLNLMRCHSCGLPQLYKALDGCNSIYDQAYNLKGIKGKISVFLLFLSFVSFLL